MSELQEIIKIARKAGDEILRIYHDPRYSGQVEHKEDNSPLTLADKAAHEVIMEELIKTFPGIPVISEEGKDMPYSVRSEYSEFWLVDPLDGTKEFIRRNGEFTVNIALIRDRYPVAGVVYIPVEDTSFYGEGDVAYKVAGGKQSPISVGRNNDDRTAVRSRSHASEEEGQVLEKYRVANTISRGSALKFCTVADGTADLYYRHGPTMEWDTAAGQAVIEAAGGQVFIGNDARERFIYNKEDLLNPGFLCLGFDV